MRSALDATESFSDNPSAFLALNSGNEYFSLSSSPGVIAYRPRGRYLLQFAGPFAPAEDYTKLLEEFMTFADEQRHHIVAVQLQRADAERYAELGFTVNQLGASYAVDLAQFTTKGARFMRLRNKISRAFRSGLTVDEVDPEAESAQLEKIDQEWLRSKGRHVKELRFLVGDHPAHLREHRRLFLGRIEGSAAAYIAYSPVFGSRPGWLHDLSRRRPEVPPGVLEAINMTAIKAFQAEQAPWLHFGFTPFTGLDQGCEVESASAMVGRAVRFLAKHGNAVYPAQSQLAYKEKWAPHVVLPEYIAFQGRPRVAAIWSLLRVTNAI